MLKSNFNEMFLREKKAERAIEKITLQVEPFSTTAGEAINTRFTSDMIDMMTIFMMEEYGIPSKCFANCGKAFIPIVATMMAYGYAIALADANLKEKE